MTHVLLQSKPVNSLKKNRRTFYGNQLGMTDSQSISAKLIVQMQLPEKRNMATLRQKQIYGNFNKIRKGYNNQTKMLVESSNLKLYVNTYCSIVSTKSKTTNACNCKPGSPLLGWIPKFQGCGLNANSDIIFFVLNAWLLTSKRTVFRWLLQHIRLFHDTPTNLAIYPMCTAEGEEDRKRENKRVLLSPRLICRLWKKFWRKFWLICWQYFWH